MGDDLTVIVLGQGESRFDDALSAAVRGRAHQCISWLTDPMQERRILFAVPLPDSGVNPAFYQLLAFLRAHPGCLARSVGGILVDGSGDLYTKSVARELVLSAALAGCTFPGRPLVEGVGGLRNFTVQAKNAGCGLLEAYHLAASDLTVRVLSFAPPRRNRPRLLVLHASSHHTSNTMALWAGVRERLGEVCSVQEIGLRNGTLDDCSGCPYTMCIHFGEKGECFYGGVMSREVYPAVRRADGVVMLCPNYNDALSANLTAFINRLTALFRQTRFYDKALFALVVSGYSGSDLVARQLISAMNMNKSFYLPGRFALLETANDPGEAMGLPGVRDRLDRFADHMLEVLARRA